MFNTRKVYERLALEMSHTLDAVEVSPLRLAYCRNDAMLALATAGVSLDRLAETLVSIGD